VWRRAWTRYAERVPVLFVYGTLLRGEANHPLIAEARFLGEARTEAAFDLVDMGEYPGLVPGGSTAVHGELYEVSSGARARLDELEGHPHFYRRQPIRLRDGSVADAYLLVPEQAAGRPRIASGRWTDGRR
jgi:gamma-glutamylaminecyclotransferase